MSLHSVFKYDGEGTNNMPNHDGYGRRFEIIYENRISSVKEMKRFTPSVVSCG